MAEGIDRREFLAKAAKGGAAFTLLGFAGGALDACGNSNGDKKATTTTVTKQQALAVGVDVPPPGTKLGGNITMGTEADESGMDPSYAHFDSTGVMYARTIYDPLAIVNDKGQVVPYLAQSIVPNKTFTEWTITLRPNVTFHDGTPCDGQALVHCMQLFQASALVSFALTYVKKNGIKQTGPLSCTLSMEAPWVSFPAWLCGYIGGQIAYLFSPTQYKKGESVLATHPIGTGPFVFKQWDVNSFFTGTKNPNYWRKDKYGRALPYADSWTFKPLPDVASRWEALQSGTIQIMHTDDDPTIVLIEKSGLPLLLDNELPYGESDCNFGMVNLKDPFFKDIRLRKAAAYAVSQKYYCAGPGDNLLTPISGPFSKPSPYFGTTTYPTYDLNQAKSLVSSWMADNGGKAPVVTCTTTSSTESLSTATLICQMLNAAGFSASPAQVLQSALISDAVEGKFQLFDWRQFAQPDPDLNYPFWSSKGGIVNFTGNNDAILDAALDAARQTSDQSVRLESYQKAAQQMAVDLPYIWYSRDIWCITAQKNIKNWNNPTTPSGARGLSMLSGIIWPTEVWMTGV